MIITAILYQFILIQFVQVSEKYCKYVSYTGIKNEFSTRKPKEIIYVKADEVINFVIPDYKFILITGDSDATVPDDMSEKANEILQNPNLVHWFAQNLAIRHPKMSPIPIGLDYRTAKQNKNKIGLLGPNYQILNKVELGPKIKPKEQEQFILDLPKKPYYERELKIYCNFLHSIRGRYGVIDRRQALDQISHDLIAFEKELVPQNYTFINMTKYTFVLSPLGCGLDCYRTWEALILGCIPIVKTSILDDLYKDLPVLIVQEWSDVNQELLEKTVQEFKTKKFNYDKLTLKYWTSQIYATQIK
jgi:hypothetical protein